MRYASMAPMPLLQRLANKNYLLAICLLAGTLAANGQQKTEGLSVDWPASYKWKVIQQEDKNNVQTIRIIPGKETKRTATLLGTISAYGGLKYASLDSLITDYQNRIDTGTVLTVLEKDTTRPHFWVLFKTETPATKKYPEAESDLYYVIQGESSVFENYIAIKQPWLSKEFVEKWTEVFKTARLTLE